MDFKKESQLTLKRIKASLNSANLTAKDLMTFEQRLDQHFEQLFTLMVQIYGHRYDFHFHLQSLTQTLLSAMGARPTYLKSKDTARLNNPQWFQDEKMLGMACYVDLFSNNLQTLLTRIPYLKSLGVTFLHLMPLYHSPEGDSDGGYAVSDYRKVNPKLGSNRDLITLAKALDKHGISLVLDFVFNHTSDEHPWAQLAQQGDETHQGFYYMFDDKGMPNQYEEHLREIFPQVRRGNFSWNPSSQKWVWTTFNNFQWDLNYGNPAVFTAIADEMLYLANIGCDVLRLDALAFIWKEMGTNCENQPKAHMLIKAFNCCLQIVAPSVVFKSEAIVHPDEVNKYIDADECQLSYNPLLMALMWNSLATRKTRLLTHSLRKNFTIPSNTSWVNYARCHDDIGWTFDDNVAQNLGINGHDHRHFLNQFYTGRFEGSFAKGVPFADNPATGDCRVCGSLASLAGLEQAIESNDPIMLEHAISRIILIHSIILSIGGIPLLYSGDELGLINDYSFKDEADKENDERWVHRIAVTDNAIDQATKCIHTPQAKIYRTLQTLITLRKSLPVLGRGATKILDLGNQHIFGFERYAEQASSMICVHNFSEHPQTFTLQAINRSDEKLWRDLIAKREHRYKVTLEAYQIMWLVEPSKL